MTESRPHDKPEAPQAPEPEDDDPMRRLLQSTLGGGASGEGEPPVSSEAGPEDDAEAEHVRSLLRRALQHHEPEAPEMLRGVQRRLRQRSRGKFYADGWSVEREAPTATWLVTSLVMLAIIGLTWAVLAPFRGDPVKVDPHPGVQIRMQ